MQENAHYDIVYKTLFSLSLLLCVGIEGVSKYVQRVSQPYQLLLPLKLNMQEKHFTNFPLVIISQFNIMKLVQCK